MINILVVCTANICRSPMGAALLRGKIGRRDLSDAWQVQSTGTWASYGSPASEFSVLEMSERGLDIADHRSQPITDELLRNANVVLVMARNHRDAISAEFPMHAEKVFLFSELGSSDYDIVDPIGQPRTEYAACARELETLVNQGFDWFVELATASAAK